MSSEIQFYFCYTGFMTYWVFNELIHLYGIVQGKEDTSAVIRLEKEMATGLWYSCLENSMDRGAWQGYRESDTTEQLTLAQLLAAIQGMLQV